MHVLELPPRESCTYKCQHHTSLSPGKCQVYCQGHYEEHWQYTAKPLAGTQARSQQGLSACMWSQVAASLSRQQIKEASGAYIPGASARLQETRQHGVTVGDME